MSKKPKTKPKAVVNERQEELSIRNDKPEASGETNNKEVFNADPEFVGYIHNISPLKKDRFFDFQIQGKKKEVRGVCFSPTKLKRFTELSASRSPVKIKKFRVDTKSNSEDYIMGNDVTIEHFPDIDFPIVDKPATMNLATIKSLCPGQSVTVTAKVASLYPTKNVGPNNMKVQNATVVDASAAMKITLWREFADTIKPDDTYTFYHLSVYKDKMSHEICLCTAYTGSSISPATPFKEVLAVSVATSATVHGEIIGVEKVASYLSCRKCLKKVDSTNPAGFIECSTCHLKQKLMISKKKWFAQVLFENHDDKQRLVNLTFFEDAIMKLSEVVGNSLSTDEITQSSIESVFYKSSKISLTYDRRTKVVETVHHAE